MSTAAAPLPALTDITCRDSEAPALRTRAAREYPGCHIQVRLGALFATTIIRIYPEG